MLTLGREIKEFNSLLERLEGEKREAEHQSMTSGHMLQQLDSEMSRVMERMRISQGEMQRLAAERAEQEGDNHGAAGRDQRSGTGSRPTRVADRGGARIARRIAPAS